MKVGLLWNNDDPGRDLAEKVGRAARRYRQKFSTPANVCYVHPSTFSGDASTLLSTGASTLLSTGGRVRKVGEVHVAPLPSVLRHHFWVGREEKRRRRRTVIRGGIDCSYFSIILRFPGVPIDGTPESRMV
jgi:hypothetical protein